MIKDTTCGVEETKIFTVFKGTSREHNFDYNGKLRLSKAEQEKIKCRRLQMSTF